MGGQDQGRGLYPPSWGGSRAVVDVNEGVGDVVVKATIFFPSFDTTDPTPLASTMYVGVHAWQGEGERG